MKEFFFIFIYKVKLKTFHSWLVQIKILNFHFWEKYGLTVHKIKNKIKKKKKEKKKKKFLKTLNYNKPLDIFKQIGLAWPTLDYHYLFSY